MDEPDNSPHENAGERRPDTLLTKIRLWTRISSYSYGRVAVDEAPATRKIADLSSIAARYVSPFLWTSLCRSLASRTRSHPSRPSTRNPAAESSHASGPSLRTSTRLIDRLERTRALSAKYGLDLTEAELRRHTSQPVPRVERPIRMRIRFWCHHCNTQYGNSRVCEQCAHQRCNRCVRHPPRRTAPRLRLADAGHTYDALSTETASTSALSIAQNISVPIIPESDPHSRRQSPSRIYAHPISQESIQEAGTRPEHIDSNYSRMAKRPRVRVRHTCHECQRTFMRKESTCAGCGHERCKDCPRNPPRRGTEDAGLSNRPSERRIPSLSSESDDGGDEYEHETTSQEVPTSTGQRWRAGDTAASSRRGSGVMESIDTRDTVLTPPEPPPVV